MISIRRVSLGGGYRYLVDSVAKGDGAAEHSSPLARYYASSGTPPGIFLGRGLADIDGGRGVACGMVVTEEHLYNMLACCADPVTGEPVGTTPRAPRGGAPVAGFDLTFSPSKSVSVAWALADEGTKAVIASCHRAAIDYVLRYAEREVFRSRSGTNGIVDEDVTGVIAAAFTHYTSRADDPQLHDHVVVWNRARSVADGAWRTLDSRAIFKATTTLSELHQGVLADILTASLGLGWETRPRRHSASPRYEITGVPETLMAEFSRRATEIAAAATELRADFAAVHGRSPTAVEDMALHSRATLSTRGAKSHRSLADLTSAWRERAGPYVAVESQLAFVQSLAGRNDLPLLRADDLREPMLVDAADAVVRVVAERHATYTRLNLLAEAHRVLHGVRFAHPDDRVAVSEQITGLAITRSVLLSPPALHHVPRRFVRADGSSRLGREGHLRYTTTALLDAEKRLIEASREHTGPSVGIEAVAGAVETDLPGRSYRLEGDQARAVAEIATSSRVLDVLVGPAGTGKSTTMAGLRACWESTYGEGSVIALAPSAAAAEVLGDELGSDAENTAKWLTEQRRLPELIRRRDQIARGLARHPHPASNDAAKLRQRLVVAERAIATRRLHPGQLVIVDEASLAGTFALDEIVSAARDARAKVLLVGDYAQLSAIDAGGAFALLIRDRGDLVPELCDVRRFSSVWEKTASVQLRTGNLAAIDAYETNGRITGGSRDELLDQIHGAWSADIAAGKSSLMIAGDTAAVAELNRRARAARIAAGAVAKEGLLIADGAVAGVGDEVVTRENNRLLVAGRRFVKNGDRFVVTATNDDGSMAVRRVGRGGPGGNAGSAGTEVVLPADYVAHHVELGYATTAHRAQGQTVDTAHALLSPTTTREVCYVAATRGRESNRLYLDVSFDPDPATSHDGTLRPDTAREVLVRVLANEGAELSAHETLRRAHDEVENLATLAAEYQSLAAAGEAERWDDLLERSGLGELELEEVRRSPAQGSLLAALRTAEARGLDVEAVLPRLVGARSFDDAGDIASVLHGRVDRYSETAGSTNRESANFIAGVIPRATGVTDPDIARALTERDEAMEHRARQLATRAVELHEPWVRRLGVPPADPYARERWLAAVAVVAAYRERWGVGGDERALGPEGSTQSLEQVSHRRREEAAVARARDLAGSSRSEPFSASRSVETAEEAVTNQATI